MVAPEAHPFRTAGLHSQAHIFIFSKYYVQTYRSGPSYRLYTSRAPLRSPLPPHSSSPTRGERDSVGPRGASPLGTREPLLAGASSAWRPGAGAGETYCSHLSCAFVAVSVRKLVSRIVLTTPAPSPRCDTVVMLEVAHRPCCSGGGVGPHFGGALGSHQMGGGVLRDVGPPISPGKPQATD